MTVITINKVKGKTSKKKKRKTSKWGGGVGGEKNIYIILHSAIVFSIEKNPHINGPVQFKTRLFKGQPYHSTT